MASADVLSDPRPRRARELWLVELVAFSLALAAGLPANSARVEAAPSKPGVGVQAARVAVPAVLLATSGDAAVRPQPALLPGNSIYVSTRGSDRAKGIRSSPYRSLTHAIAVADSGSTIVLRSGAYHESVGIPGGKRLTVEAYPGETVWMDGSSAITGWTSSGRVWRKDGWKTKFDASPTFTTGAPDGTTPGWRWINPFHPMAAHPDAVWIAGVQQREVGSLAQVRPGRFFVDYANDRLYVGSNPHGNEVRASTLAKAIYVEGAGSVLRGFGVRRYATSVPLMGTVVITGKRVQMRGMTVSENASTGIGIFAADAVISHVTVEKSGLMGIGTNYADNLLLDHVRAIKNNYQHFNQAPVSGGVKLARSRGVTIRDSVLSDNDGPGLWTDQSVYNLKLYRTKLQDNLGCGAFLEISSKMVVAGNLITNNAKDGLKINNTSNVEVWNNTLVGNGRSLDIVQDGRIATDRSVPGHDWRRPFPDPTMTWLLGPVKVANNVIAAQNSSANCMMCVEDYTHRRSAGAIGVTADGNLYSRLSRTRPTWLAVWPRADTVNPYVFNTLTAYSTTTGQDRHSTAIEGSRSVTSIFRLTAAAQQKTKGKALQIPSSIAGLIGVPAGSRALGYQP